LEYGLSLQKGMGGIIVDSGFFRVDVHAITLPNHLPQTIIGCRYVLNKDRGKIPNQLLLLVGIWQGNSHGILLGLSNDLLNLLSGERGSLFRDK
jgi:hypothetical protein